ncbi:16S rRNA (cytosine(967)-C(5))-methyltransferase protein [Dioscorea alata]|uniref:16S rRNA (Cytosine(967)-C(5))-methyltransferase protein n=1 Tax=Dioscorea alata TaxID=55571 RepID=A0ACB7WCU8_DIOAL|nr:16S rRNA (cytosine(967)-C(5))-methyltransferase protein [Dioscorea alata]
MRRASYCFLRTALRRRHFRSAPKMDDSSSSSSERYRFNPTLAWDAEVEDYFIKAYGADHFARISKSLTHPSSYSCIRVNTLKTTSDSVIKKLVSMLDHKITGGADIDAREQIVVTDFDHSTEEQSLNETSTPLDPSLDHGSVQVSGDNVELVCKCPYLGLDNVVFVQGSGPHLLWYEGQSGKAMKEVIISRKCAEAVLRGAQIYVPGVLACSAHVEKGELVAVSVGVEQRGSDGSWGVGITRGTVLQGSESDPHYCERKGLYIGQGTALMSRASIFRASKGIAVEMSHRVYRLPSFHDVLKGEIFLQNLPSIVTAHVLEPQEGEKILDMCAAPGGKTTAIAILMKDKGEVVACDRSHNKVMDIMKLATEMGLTCINAYKLDALKSVCQVKEILDVGVEILDLEVLNPVVTGTVGSPNGEMMNDDITKCRNGTKLMQTGNSRKTDTKKQLNQSEDRMKAVHKRNGPGRNHCMGGRVRTSKGHFPNSFDRVLLDAPCSALGLRPRLFAGEETLESLMHHARYQRRMFDRAVQLVRPGGVIVYSTCTINPGENEALVRYALDKYEFLSLAAQNPRIGGPGLVGRCDLFDGKYVEEWLTESEAKLVQRFDPSSTLDTIGFFIAKFNVGQKEI